MSWSSRKKKREHFFVLFNFSGGIFLKFVFHLNVQCIEYTFRIYIFLDIKKKKKLLQTLLLLVFKFAESLQCILNLCLWLLCGNGKWYLLKCSLFNFWLSPLKNFALFIVFAWKALRFTTAFLFFFFAATFPEYLLKIH